MRKKDKETKENKKYKKTKKNHAKTTKPIMKDSQIHKGDDCNGMK